MNNDTNNNLNGTVLGNVNESNGLNTVLNEPVVGENVSSPVQENEMLNNNVVLNEGLSQNQVITPNVVEPNSNPKIENSSNVSTPTPNNAVNVEQDKNQNAYSANLINNVQSGINNNLNQNSENNELAPNSQPTNPNNLEQSVELGYTNPKTINPTPMPGFENSGAIGTTPPISLEPEKAPKKKMNKLLFIILILILLVGIGFGTYYVLNYTDLLKKTEEVTIQLYDMEFNLGEELPTDILSYAEIKGTDSRNCTLDISKVDIENPGTYQFSVTCGETLRKGNISIIDNTELDVTLKTVYKVKGDTISADEFATNSNYKYEFVNEEEVTNILNNDSGTFKVKIKVSSNNKNTEVDGTLIITQYAIRGFLICSSKEQSVDNATMIVADSFSIVNDGNNGYGNITTESNIFKFTDEIQYNEYKNSYNSNKTITINDITGSATFDDNNLTITISNILDNNKVISEFGADNMNNYRSIKNYFEITKGYSCIYEKAND